MGSLLPPSLLSASALLAKLVAKMRNLHAHKKLNFDLGDRLVILTHSE